MWKKKKITEIKISVILFQAMNSMYLGEVIEPEGIDWNGWQNNALGI